jgi:solute carrier family 25 (mitochondrial iron transporter), member 28/37
MNFFTFSCFLVEAVTYFFQSRCATVGHYATLRQALFTMWQQEGASSLIRSFPVTLATNVPYGMVMVATNEACKEALSSSNRPSWQSVLLASAVGGSVAATVTTPLDRIKTALQTQRLQPACDGTAPIQSLTCPHAKASAVMAHTTWRDAATSIWKQEGAIGFFRGVVPRVLSHTPAVAISWTTYETVKRYLMAP